MADILLIDIFFNTKEEKKWQTIVLNDRGRGVLFWDFCSLKVAIKVITIYNLSKHSHVIKALLSLHLFLSFLSLLPPLPPLFIPLPSLFLPFPCLSPHLSLPLAPLPYADLVSESASFSGSASRASWIDHICSADPGEFS